MVGKLFVMVLFVVLSCNALGYANDMPFKHVGMSEDWYVNTFGHELKVDLPHDQLVRLRQGKDYFYELNWRGVYLGILPSSDKPYLVRNFPIKSRGFKVELSVMFDGKTQRSLGYELKASYDAYGFEKGKSVALYIPGSSEFVELINKVFGTTLKKVEERSIERGIPSKTEQYVSDEARLVLHMMERLQILEEHEQDRTFHLFVYPQEISGSKYGRKRWTR